MSTFILKGNNITLSSTALASSIKKYIASVKSSMITSPTSTISNSAAWTNELDLKNNIIKAMNAAFDSTKFEKRTTFAEAVSDAIDTWFMDPKNQSVISCTIPGVPPVVIPGPAVPNPGSIALKNLKKDLSKIFNNVNDRSPKPETNFERDFDAAIERYFITFKSPSVQIWTCGALKGIFS